MSAGIGMGEELVLSVLEEAIDEASGVSRRHWALALIAAGAVAVVAAVVVVRRRRATPDAPDEQRVT